MPRLRVLGAAELDAERTLQWTTEHAPAAAPWPSEELAAAAAMPGLLQQLGGLPPDVTLVFEPLDASVLPPDQLPTPEERASSLSFRVCWRGVSTSRYCLVSIRGRSQYECTTNMCAFEAVPGSDAALLTEAQAVERVMARAKQDGAGPAQLADMAATVKPRLEYVWDPEHNQSLASGNPGILSPQWRPFPWVPLLVDAVSGRVWIDD